MILVGPRGHGRRPARLLLAAACAGCRPAAAPPAPPRQWASDEQKAVDLAANFLAMKKTDWGRPESATRRPGGPSEALGPRGDAFMVTYPTPPDEEKVGGPRAVFVNIATGKAESVPRD